MSMADKCPQVNGEHDVFCDLFICARSSEQSTCNCIVLLLWTLFMEHDSDPDSRPSLGKPSSGTGIALAPGVRVPAQSIQITFVRSSGPGGQNVNKRSTKAQLRIRIDDIPLNDRAHARFCRLARGAINSVGELVLSADDTRSQSRNKKACMDRLREIVMRAMIEPKSRRATKPTRGSIRRRLEDKKRRSETKQRRKPPE